MHAGSQIRSAVHTTLPAGRIAAYDVSVQAPCWIGISARRGCMTDAKSTPQSYTDASKAGILKACRTSLCMSFRVADEAWLGEDVGQLHVRPVIA